MSTSNLSVGSPHGRAAMPFGMHEDDRPASKRATRDAVVRLTRLATPELEEIARGGGVKEQMLLNAQSSTAAKDALESLIGTKQMSRGGGDAVGRHSSSRRLADTTFRTLSGTSPPQSPSANQCLEGGMISPLAQTTRPDTPPTPLWRGDDRNGISFNGDITFHSGSADTLPSKARALLDRHSYYTAGVRDQVGLRPRDYTVLGESRPLRLSKGSRHQYRMRSVKPSRSPEDEEQEIIPGEPDRTGEAERVLRVKQMVKMVMLAQGPKSKSQLERSFRMADKDGSGELDFDELNFSLRHDFQIKGMTPGDVTRIFDNMDVDKSGYISTTEFVNAIESVPFPQLKNQVGYQTLPTPHSLKTRQSFQVWPTTADLGTFQYRNRDTKRVVLTVRNVGYVELRFRVRVDQLMEGQTGIIIDRPRGVIAPGLRGKIVVDFSAATSGSLTALIVIESSDQLCEIPVIGNVSDGFEKFEELLSLLPDSSLQGQEEADDHSLLSSLKYTQRQESLEKQSVKKQGIRSQKHEVKTVTGKGGWFGESSPTQSRKIHL